MNTSLFRNTLLTIAALALAPASHAMLLVGWHDFDGTTGNETPDYAAPGFSGTILSPTTMTKNTGSRDLGGDNGLVGGINYGDSTYSSGSGNDGTVRLLTGSTGTIFSITNTSGVAISLRNLFFDATSTSTSAVMQIAYRIGTTGSFSSLASFTNLNPTGDFNDPVLQADFSDLSLSLVGLAVQNLETIQFRFLIPDGANGGRLDNIAITAIPEPASLVALGLVLGSGLFLRQRPRQFAPSLA